MWQIIKDLEPRSVAVHSSLKASWLGPDSSIASHWISSTHYVRGGPAGLGWVHSLGFSPRANGGQILEISLRKFASCDHRMAAGEKRWRGAFFCCWGSESSEETIFRRENSDEIAFCANLYRQLAPPILAGWNGICSCSCTNIVKSGFSIQSKQEFHHKHVYATWETVF